MASTHIETTDLPLHRIALSVHLARVLLWKGLKEQKSSLFLFPGIIGVLLASLAVVAAHFPVILTSLTRHAVERAAELQFRGSGKQQGILISFLRLQAPYLLAIFAGFTGAGVAQRSANTESARGGLELMLATVYGIADVFVGLLLSSFILTAIGWFCLVSAMGVGSVLLVSAFHLGVSIPASELGLDLAMQLTMALTSVEIALFVALVAPKLSQIRAGTFTNLSQTLGVLPGLAMLVLLAFSPGLSPFYAALIALCVAALLFAVGIAALGRYFRPEFLLHD